MKRIFGYDQLKLERKIVEDYGDGQLLAETYLFEQIPRLQWQRQAAPEFIQCVRDAGPVIAFLDRSPDNLWCATQYLDPQCLPLIVAHEVNCEELARLLACTNCDMYVLSLAGELLAVATHEDDEPNGIRQISVVIGKRSEC